MLIEAARQDAEHGIYYAFPFLAGTRPSEQLGLLWEDVDFERNVIRIHRIQERDGSLTDMTKTAAGTRNVPMGATLREMLPAWRLPAEAQGRPARRFPGPGHRGGAGRQADGIRQRGDARTLHAGGPRGRRRRRGAG